MYNVINMNGDSTNATLTKDELAAFNSGSSIVKIQDIVIIDGLPQLSLLFIGTNEDIPYTIVRHVWLMPFRGYCFQVSGTINGENNLGSTPVVGLGNIVNAKYDGEHGSNSSIFASNFRLADLARPIFDSMAKAAIMDFHMNAEWRILCSEKPTVPYMKFSFDDEKALSMFTRLCVEYVTYGKVKTPKMEELSEKFDIYSDTTWIKDFEDEAGLRAHLAYQITSYRDQIGARLTNLN